ncbi:hypothetical protein PSUM_01500 [Pseudomonas umsongensis]|uniref:Uncharacterized protein n=1 Tax=Pseudomonas umsongensis TaxID=198618 RepID=A0ABX4E029_9PSED|nr:hypothetical protein [Pseudomonas umsongensis]OXR34606.1 hypothetical protein PSUM_01500 [Pseudomonas umsongensis]
MTDGRDATYHHLSHKLLSASWRNMRAGGRRKLNKLQFFRKTPVVILVALRNGNPAELVCDCSIRNVKTKEFSIHKMT